MKLHELFKIVETQALGIPLTQRQREVRESMPNWLGAEKVKRIVRVRVPEFLKVTGEARA